MAITIFQVICGNETLKNIEKLLNRKKKPFVKTVQDKEGKEVELKTTIENVKKQNNIDDDGIYALLKYDFIDDYVDGDGKQRSVIKTNRINFVFVSGSIYLLIFASKNEASKISLKISNIIYKQIDDPILSCQIRPNDMENFIREHDAKILSCSWKELNIPTLGNASISGTGIGESNDFKRFDDHGSKNSVRLQIPSKNITVSMNRNGSVHFFTKHSVPEQIDIVQKHILKICS